jgi:hypothetical protein
MDIKTNTIVMNQFRGLGDILFIIPICRYFISKGHDIIIPVYPEFLNISRNFHDIKFVNKYEFDIDYESLEVIVRDDMTILPIRWSWEIFHPNGGNYESCMADKYKYVELPVLLWKTLNWVRNTDIENDLYYNVLGLKDDSEYNVINTSFCMAHNLKLDVNNSYQNVNMQIFKDFNMLDWQKVLENAKTIHTVGTSLFYIMEFMNLPMELHLYRRPMEQDFSWYLPLSNLDYKLHYDVSI